MGSEMCIRDRIARDRHPAPRELNARDHRPAPRDFNNPTTDPDFIEKFNFAAVFTPHGKIYNFAVIEQDHEHLAELPKYVYTGFLHATLTTLRSTIDIVSGAFAETLQPLTRQNQTTIRNEHFSLAIGIQNVVRYFPADRDV